MLLYCFIIYEHVKLVIALQHIHIGSILRKNKRYKPSVKWYINVDNRVRNQEPINRVAKCAIV